MVSQFWEERGWKFPGEIFYFLSKRWTLLGLKNFNLKTGCFKFSQVFPDFSNLIFSSPANTWRSSQHHYQQAVRSNVTSLEGPLFPIALWICIVMNTELRQLNYWDQRGGLGPSPAKESFFLGQVSRGAFNYGLPFGLLPGKRVETHTQKVLSCGVARKVGALILGG